jgi:hypothetical protein
MSFSGGRSGGRRRAIPDPLPSPSAASLPEMDDDDGGGGDGRIGNRSISRRSLGTPPTPMLVLRPDATPSPVMPDTEANVARQTTVLFGTFVMEMDERRHQQTADVVDTCLLNDDDDQVVIGGAQSVDVVAVAAGSQGDDGTMTAVFANNGLLPIATGPGASVPVPDELLS